MKKCKICGLASSPELHNGCDNSNNPKCNWYVDRLEKMDKIKNDFSENTNDITGKENLIDPKELIKGLKQK